MEHHSRERERHQRWSDDGGDGGRDAFTEDGEPSGELSGDPDPDRSTAEAAGGAMGIVADLLVLEECDPWWRGQDVPHLHLTAPSTRDDTNRRSGPVDDVATWSINMSAISTNRASQTSC